jgi:hypoxanthine phosphoribosyltransferase
MVRQATFHFQQPSAPVTTAITKTYVDANSLLADSWRLGRQVLESGFRPTHIVGIWRGGAPVGIAVQELLEFHGQRSDHIAIRTSSYEDIDSQGPRVRVFSVSYLIKVLNPDDRLLIVDDVFDSGRSIEALIGKRCRNNMPDQVRVATVYYKPSRNRTDLQPDYFVTATEDWLVFPHELKGLTEEEIRQHKPTADVILGR